MFGATTAPMPLGARFIQLLVFRPPGLLALDSHGRIWSWDPDRSAWNLFHGGPPALSLEDGEKI